MESRDRKVQIMFTGACVENSSEDNKNTDPYRSEMMGQYVGLLLTLIMERYTKTYSHAILSSDNDSALDSIGLYEWTTVGQQHFDIITAALRIRKLLRSKIDIEQVLGHADQKAKSRPPTRPELLNQSCDFMAKLTREIAEPIGPRMLPFEGISMWKNNTKYYNDFQQKVRHDYYKCKALPVLTEKFGWTTVQFNMVDWESNRKSQKLLSSYSNIWIAKYVTGFLPIGVNMQRRKEWGQNHCSRCGLEVETNKHIGRCKEVTSTNLFQENLEVFEQWMDTMQTPTLLKVHVLAQITAWRMNIPCIFPLGKTPAPITSQLCIGKWEHFMEGRLHNEWKIYMEAHYQSQKSRRTGSQ